MENETGNTQVQPVANPPTPQGPTAEELAAKVAELERQSEGRLRDLQAERQKRQELESRMSPPVTQPVPPTANLGEPQDELGKVLKPYLDPMMNRVKAAEAYVAKTQEDKAYDYLAAKTGKTRDAILEDKGLQDKLVNVVRRYGFSGNAYEITTKAYEIMELENLRAADAERKRTASATSVSSMPAGNPVAGAPAKKSFTRADWTAMSLAEYDKLQSSGSFAEDEQGNIVFSPRA